MQINCFIMSTECINLQKTSKFIVFYLAFKEKRFNWFKRETKKAKNIIWHKEQRNGLLAIQIGYPNEKNQIHLFFFLAMKVILFRKSPANRI